MRKEFVNVDEVVVSEVFDYASDEFAYADEYVFIDEDEAIDACVSDQDRWYQNAISGAGLLTKNDEIELGKKIKAGQAEDATAEEIALGKEAQQILVEHNLPLVYAIASEHKYKKAEKADLIQEGNLGLIKAAEKFDYEKGFRFSTYATWWIKKYIKKAVSMAYDYDDFTTHFVENEDDEADAYANMFGADEHDYYADVNDDMVTGYVNDTLHKGIDCLQSLEKQVIEGRYCINGAKARTIDELSKELKISKNGVRALEASALRKLKNSCHVLGDCV